MTNKQKFFVLLSLLAILGAALNDGMLGWGLQIPFLFLLYNSLTLPKRQRLLLVWFIFSIAILISISKTESSLVYPVIGQKVLILEDLPLWSLSLNLYSEEEFRRLRDSIYTSEGRHIEVKDTDHIPQNSTFHVKRILVKHPSMLTTYYYILSNGSKEFAVIDHDLNKFCEKVDWKFCEKVARAPSYLPADPMNKVLRIIEIP